MPVIRHRTIVRRVRLRREHCARWKGVPRPSAVGSSAAEARQQAHVRAHARPILLQKIVNT